MDETKAVGRSHLDRIPRSRWYVLLAVFVSCLAIGSAGVSYTSWAVGEQRKAEREADRRWCELLTTLDSAYQAAPPQTETGRRLAADVHKLRSDLGC